MQLVKNEPQAVPDLPDQALAWITRLSSDCVSETDLQEFALWLAQSNGHKAAFDDMLNFWQDLGAVKHLPIDIPATPVCDKATAGLSVKTQWPSLLALAASVALAIIVYPYWSDTVEQTQFFSTTIGQQQTISLDDGSTITLNTATRLEVSFTSTQRNITLHSGEAFFEVAKDPQRPFVVDSCFSEVRAVGTAFNILCSSKQGTVTVTEGVVQVAGDKQDRALATLIGQGQSVSVSHHLGVSKPQQIDSQRIISWRQGQLIFEETPLAEVIHHANRYSPTPIYLGSPQLAELHVTGRFESTDTQTLLAALKHSLSLESTVQDDKSIILNKAVQ